MWSSLCSYTVLTSEKCLKPGLCRITQELCAAAFLDTCIETALSKMICKWPVFAFVHPGFGVAQTKAVMTFVSGIPMGPPRLPLVDASEEFIVKAKAKLDSIVWPDGNWCSLPCQSGSGDSFSGIHCHLAHSPCDGLWFLSGKWQCAWAPSC